MILLIIFLAAIAGCCFKPTRFVAAIVLAGCIGYGLIVSGGKSSCNGPECYQPNADHWAD